MFVYNKCHQRTASDRSGGPGRPGLMVGMIVVSTASSSFVISLMCGSLVKNYTYLCKLVHGSPKSNVPYKSMFFKYFIKSIRLVDKLKYLNTCKKLSLTIYSSTRSIRMLMQVMHTAYGHFNRSYKMAASLTGQALVSTHRSAASVVRLLVSKVYSFSPPLGRESSVRLRRQKLTIQMIKTTEQ